MVRIYVHERVSPNDGCLTPAADKSQFVTIEGLRSFEKGLTFGNLIIMNSNDFSTK